MRCPNGHAAPEGAAYCPECGAGIPEPTAAVAMPVPTAADEVAPPGQPTPAVTEPGVTASRRDGSRKRVPAWVLAVAAVGVLLVATLAVFLGLTQHSGAKPQAAPTTTEPVARASASQQTPSAESATSTEPTMPTPAISAPAVPQEVSAVATTFWNAMASGDTTTANQIASPGAISTFKEQMVDDPKTYKFTSCSPSDPVPGPSVSAGDKFWICDWNQGTAGDQMGMQVEVWDHGYGPVVQNVFGYYNND